VPKSLTVKPEKFVYKIFSIKRRFQQSKSRTPLQRNLRNEDIKDGYPLKSRYFTAVGSSIAKAFVAGRHRLKSCRNKTTYV